MEDTKLWENIRKGDKGALKILHKKYYHQMYLYTAKSTGSDASLAEELVSDCFIKIWENRHRIQIHYSLKQYLFSILHNSIIDSFRKKGSKQLPSMRILKLPVKKKSLKTS
ncbi:MAG: sigma factor [Prolixibacteraceae bacterium]|nr:sigma factor [Prolixibacteraceae bacterium]